MDWNLFRSKALRLKTGLPEKLILNNKDKTVTQENYIISGGIKGRERLKIIAQVMARDTNQLLDCVGIKSGMACLDAGCGGGDVTCELARRVGQTGTVVGLDMDQVKLDIARQEAKEQNCTNVEFHYADISKAQGKAEFDRVYARFLLTHLQDPLDALLRLQSFLKPGGVGIFEDIDFSGYYTYPESEAHTKHCTLYAQAVRSRGGDPNIGQRLPVLVQQAGFKKIQIQIVQPVALEGDVKLITPITMENIAETVLEEGLASQEEVDAIVRKLYAFAYNTETVAGFPRIVQVWGTC